MKSLSRNSSQPRLALFSALVAAAALAGCSTGVKLNDSASVPVETRSTAPTAPATQSAAQSAVATVDVSKSDALANVGRIIYFDFDSYVIRDEFKPVLDAYSKVMTKDRAKRIAVEGHADERGSREYNLALGQKRAEAVAKSLTLLGVSDNQVEAVSFGEERPAVQGSTEEAWAKNRRAELRDR